MDVIDEQGAGRLLAVNTGQQEAWLCWLLLKEFGHHLACTLSKGMRMEKMWQDDGIMEQQRVWMHSDDATFSHSLCLHHISCMMRA